MTPFDTSESCLVFHGAALSAAACRERVWNTFLVGACAEHDEDEDQREKPYDLPHFIASVIHRTRRFGRHDAVSSVGTVEGGR